MKSKLENIKLHVHKETVPYTIKQKNVPKWQLGKVRVFIWMKFVPYWKTSPFKSGENKYLYKQDSVGL